MTLRLREGVELLRLGPGEFLLKSPAGDLYDIGQVEHDLVELLDGEHDLDALIERARAVHGRRAKREVRAFLRQLHALDLLGSAEAAADAAAEASPASTPDPVADPLSPRDPGAARNHRFDLLAVVLGWCASPPWLVVSFVAAAGFVILGVAALGGQVWDELIAHSRVAPGRLLAFALTGRLLVLTLPRELLVGTAARVWGGRVQTFGVQWVGNILPTFVCELGDSVATMTPRGRAVVLFIRTWFYAVAATVLLTTWSLAPVGSVLREACVALVVPITLGTVLNLNVFSTGDGYAAVCALAGTPRLRERALDVILPWRERDPAAGRAGDLLVLYGLVVVAWLFATHALVLFGGGWWLIDRFAGMGALAILVLPVWWYKDGLSPGRT